MRYVRELCFPPLSADFVERAACWQAAVRRWLVAPAAQAAPISDLMRCLLRATLGDPAVTPDVLALSRPLHVDPFPTQPSVFAILVWRSRLVDFLSDVWDVLGPPLLEMEESGWVIHELLMPPSEVTLCLDCLQPMAAVAQLAARHLDECEIRRLRLSDWERRGAACPSERKGS